MTKTGWKTDSVFALIIFCFFTASLLAVLMLGAGAYKNIVGKSQEGYDERVCLSYIWTKIKNADNAVYAGDFCGHSALFITEEYDGVEYRTVIYLYDGWVHELSGEAEQEFLPKDGMPVIEAESLAFEQLDDGLIKVRVNSGSLVVLPR